MMQTSDGGIGYWPGARESHPGELPSYPDADAKDAGHPVMDIIDGSISRTCCRWKLWIWLLSLLHANYPLCTYILARVEGKPVAIRALLENGTNRNYGRVYAENSSLFGGDTMKRN